MEERYDIYFAGQVQEGQDIDAVRNRLGKLFKASEQTLDLLFSGKSHAIKRDCDRATAQKYKSAMEQAGAVPVIKAQDAPQAGSAADKIAALAAAPDDTRFQQEPPAGEETTPRPETQSGGNSDLDLAPPQSDVLRPEERATPVQRDIDTSGLAVDTAASRLSEESPVPPANLQTDHLSVAEVGADIPNLPSSAQPLSPDTDALELSAAGTDFSDCALPEVPPPTLDLSGLDLEDTGADMLEEKYRNRKEPPPPATDHLSLED